MEPELGCLGASLSLTEEEETGLVFPMGLWHAEPLTSGFSLGCVLARGPWAYDKNLLILAPVEAFDDPNVVELGWCDFHIHIHCLPLVKMTKEIAAFIGDKLGRYKEEDVGRKGEVWGSSVRIRVAINVTKPRTVLGDDHLVSFTYERLPYLCYYCGCLGHLSRRCDFQFQQDFSDPGDNPPYGN
ncbi:hypothetical protein Salat_0499900 [Sesamum alatum]|uniref:CCHC-type domain-containing protein n=1 Tax=Sesamum alatum TaxID=300844 RepID=A0AAE2D0Y4_9LAMI|nr:hypothetical protein Salat_0499900 [Sesamum alatum]